MPRRSTIPTYQLHRGSGQAKVRINGKDYYLGPHGSEESKQRYEEIVRKLLTDRQREEMVLRVQISKELSVAELAAAYLRHVRSFYVKGGRSTTEVGNIAAAVKAVRERHGYDLVTSFGPRALKAIREEWIDAGLVRKSINRRVERVRRMFAWGVAEELVPVEVHQALSTVEGLSRGRSGAREGEKVRPGADALVDAIRPHVSRQV
jgi:hypothetical protein